MAWKGVITNSGIELLAQWTTGKTLTISRAAAGTGRVSETALMAQTALVSEKQAASILSNRTTEQGQKLQLQVTPQTIGYTLNQIGVWAQLDRGAETMIALFQTDTDAGVEIPGKENVPDYVYTFYGLMQFASSGGSMQVTVDADALASMKALAEAMEAHNANEDAHKELFDRKVELSKDGKIPAEQLPTAGKMLMDDGKTTVEDAVAALQKPTYNEEKTLTKLTSGEKLSVAMGKIAKAIADLISHIADKTVHTSDEERTKWNGKADGKHAAQHASGGSDPITPAAIGAAAASDLDTKVKISWYDGDLNTLYSDGHYRLGGNVTNGPATAADKGTWGNLLVVQGTNTDSCLQLLVDMSGNTFSRRVRYNATGVPGAWQKLATSTDLAGKSDTSHTHTHISAEGSNEMNIAYGAVGGNTWLNYRGATNAITDYIFGNGQQTELARLSQLARVPTYSTTDITAGTTALATGRQYLVYE